MNNKFNNDNLKTISENRLNIDISKKRGVSKFIQEMKDAK